MIDPTKPFHLKTMIRDTKTGNVYIPLKRPYQPGEVPFRLLTDANAYQDEPPVEFTPPVEPLAPTRSTSSKRQITPPAELSGGTNTTILAPKTPEAK